VKGEARKKRMTTNSIDRPAGVQPESRENSAADMQERLDCLLQAVGEAGMALILTHNDPDPDAIGSALALQFLLAHERGMESHIVYKGIISRAENEALVNYLEYPLRLLVRSELYDGVPIALIDTQPGAGNNALPPGVPISVVIDHHGWREESAAATFVDVRPRIGATSTMLTQYLRTAGIEPPQPLATALFYGIKTDTMGLARPSSEEDVEAYFYLQSRIDVSALVKIERARVPAEYFEKLVDTLREARLYNGIVVSYLGRMNRPDLAAEMADLLLRLEDTSWAICMGVHEGTLMLAVRTSELQGGADELAQEIVEEPGTAGGHGVLAGGQIPLDGREGREVARLVTQRALRYLGVAEDTEGRKLVDSLPEQSAVRRSTDIAGR